MNKKGFTLIELLIVVAIIGIIAAVAIPNLLVAMQKGKQKATMGDMKSLGTSIEDYITDWSFAPQVGAGPISNLDQPWFRPFYIKVLPDRDSWGTIFNYDVTNDLYSIQSAGRNKAFDGIPGIMLYDCTTVSDFNQDLYYSNGIFTVGPRVKK